MIAILALIIFVVLAILLLNVVALAIEVFIVVVLLIAGVIGRVVFRRPWTVYARTEGRLLGVARQGLARERPRARRCGGAHRLRCRARARAGGPAMTG